MLQRKKRTTKLDRKDFVFTEDANGEPYVTVAHSESLKNHPGGLNDNKSFENMDRMYKTDVENNGYSALKLNVPS